MESKTEIAETTGKLDGLSLFLKKLGHRIISLFEPEEVEVTFKVEGKKVSYTYTKVEHKQVA